MRSKTLVALAVAAIASTAAATYFAIVDQRLSLSDPTTGKPLFANLAGRLNDVASVTFARKDGTLTLVRTPPGWRLVEKGNYSAAFDRLRKFLVDLSESKTVEAKTSSPAVYGSLDVDDLSVPDAKGVLLTHYGQNWSRLVLAWSRKTTANDVILVAAPNLAEAVYRQSVIIATAIEGGRFIGVMVNRPTRRSLSSLFPDHGPSKAVVEPVFFGGPMSRSA